MVLKCHWNEYFLSFFYSSERIKHYCKKDFGQKKFLLRFLRFKMLHFPPPSGECCSRSKGHVIGLRDVRSCVAILLRQTRWLTERRKPCLWNVLRGRNRRRNKLHARMVLNHRPYRFIFSSKIVSSGRNGLNLCRNGVWTSRPRLDVQRCVLDILRTLIHNFLRHKPQNLCPVH